VLKACPDIVDYAAAGIGNWRDLMATTAQVRGYLGVSPSAYEDACHVMGPETAAIVVACILQRAQHINSAGGYLRALTEKARAGQFSVGPMLMAALKANAVHQRGGRCRCVRPCCGRKACPQARTPPGPDFGPVIHAGTDGRSSRMFASLAHLAKLSRAVLSGWLPSKAE
jgi:hypothetical protein